jgi:phytoene dehydrogenase-like protein
VRGGFGRLVEALVRQLREAGGTLACDARVDAVGPAPRGTRLSGPCGAVEAREVVWAAAPPSSATGRSTSFGLLYALLKTSPGGCLPSTGFFPGASVAWLRSGEARWEGAGGLSFPAPGEERSVEGLTPVVLHWPLKLEAGAPVRKGEVADALAGRLGRIVGEEAIVWHEAATPSTLERYTGNPEGAAYGWEQSPERIGGPKRDPGSGGEDGVVLAGHWAGLGGGVIPAAVSGWRAARRLLRG